MEKEDSIEQVFDKEINEEDAEEKKGKTFEEIYAENAESKRRKEAREDLFADLLTDALRLYKAAKEKYPEKEKSQVHDIPFYFKKVWDAFGEVVFEYDDLKKQIDDTKDLSNSERKRRLNDLEEKKKEATALLAELKPAQFNTYSEAKIKAWFNQLYRQFAKEAEADQEVLESQYFYKDSYLEKGQPSVSHYPDGDRRMMRRNNRQWFNEEV